MNASWEEIDEFLTAIEASNGTGVDKTGEMDDRKAKQEVSPPPPQVEIVDSSGDDEPPQPPKKRDAAAGPPQAHKKSNDGLRQAQLPSRKISNDGLQQAQLTLWMLPVPASSGRGEDTKVDGDMCGPSPVRARCVFAILSRHQYQTLIPL